MKRLLTIGTIAICTSAVGCSSTDSTGTRVGSYQIETDVGLGGSNRHVQFVYRRVRSELVPYTLTGTLERSRERIAIGTTADLAWPWAGR